VLYAAAVQGRIAGGPNAGNRIGRLGDKIDGDSLKALGSPRCATVSGFSIHANTARDSRRLEHCAVLYRSPAGGDGALVTADGKVCYGLKRPWRDGTSAVAFEPQDFLAKLAALVPAPRVHLTRFFGIPAPAAPCHPGGAFLYKGVRYRGAGNRVN
jgi:Putative transposase